MDYVRLNVNTYPFIYRNLTIAELLDRLGYGARGRNRVISSTDIKKWFWHLKMDKTASMRAAINTPKGVFIPFRVTQGLMNAPIYAHMIAEKLFAGLALAIQDDLHRGSPDRYAALEDMSNIFKRAYEEDARLHAGKTQRDVSYPKRARYLVIMTNIGAGWCGMMF